MQNCNQPEVNSTMANQVNRQLYTYKHTYI